MTAALDLRAKWHAQPAPTTTIPVPLAKAIIEAARALESLEHMRDELAGDIANHVHYRLLNEACVQVHQRVADLIAVASMMGGSR